MGRLNASRNLLTTINTFCEPRLLETVGTGLQLCEHLTVLDVSCNNLQELRGLDGLHLVELYASANSLTNLSGIAGLGDLQVLALADNQLCDLSELLPERHPVLMRLDVRHNLLAHHE